MLIREEPSEQLCHVMFTSCFLVTVTYSDNLGITEFCINLLYTFIVSTTYGCVINPTSRSNCIILQGWCMAIHISVAESERQ